MLFDSSRSMRLLKSIGRHMKFKRTLDVTMGNRVSQNLKHPFLVSHIYNYITNFTKKWKTYSDVSTKNKSITIEELKFLSVFLFFKGEKKITRESWLCTQTECNYARLFTIKKKSEVWHNNKQKKKKSTCNRMSRSSSQKRENVYFRTKHVLIHL